MAAGRRSVLSTALGVRPGEVAAVRSLAGAAFLLGLGLVVFYSAGNAIFLTRYDIRALPWVYVVNAFVVIAVGLAYGAWSARVTTDRALVTLAGALTASVAVLWALAVWSDHRVVAFLLAVWFRLLFIFAVLGLWEIASVVFDIRQAKRLFAPVALGMLVAFVVGGLLTGPLSGWLGSAHLVGIAAASFLAYTVALSRLLHRHLVGGPRGLGTVAPAGPRQIAAEPYSRQLVAMKTVTILLLYVSEYVLYEQAAATFETEDAIATFFGLFMGGTTLLMVVVAGVVAGRFISRYGLLAGTAILPAGMLVVSLAGGAYGLVVGIDTVFFALVCLLVVTDRVLGDAIGEPAGAVLFQPLPGHERMRVRLAVDGWLGSVALLVAGLVLLAFQALDLSSVAPYVLVVSAVSVAGLVVARHLYRGYVGAVRTATTLGVGSTTDPPTMLTENDLETVLSALGAEDPGTVVAASGLLQSLEPEPLVPALPVLVTHADSTVVDAAIDGLDRLLRTSPRAIESVLGRDDVPDATRARALTALGRHDPETALAWARRERIGPLAPASRALAVAAGDNEAHDELRGLTASADVADRLEAAATLGALTDAVPDVAVTVAGALVDDADPVVVDATLAAVAGRVEAFGVGGRVVERARDPAHRWTAFRALADDGRLLLVLASDLDDLPDDLAVAIIGRIPAGPDADALALRCLSDQVLCSSRRRAAFDVLARSPSAERPAGVGIDPDLDLIDDLVAAHRSAGASGPAVAGALAEEFDLARGTVWAGLALDTDQGRIADLATLVRVGDLDDRANAIEALEALLPPARRRRVVAALEPADLDDAAGGRPTTTTNAAMTLAAVAADERLGPWTRRVCGALTDPTASPAKGAPVMPSDVARVLTLKRIDIFSTLPFDALAELAALVRTVDVAAGTVVISPGVVGEELYAITSGEVEVRSVEGNVSRLGAGTVFGELAVLDPAPRSATVTAVTMCELVVVPRTTVLALAERRPTVMTEIARTLARRLRER